MEPRPSSLNFNIFEWADQFESEAENMRMTSEPQPEVNGFSLYNQEEPGTITVEDYKIEDFEIVEGDEDYKTEGNQLEGNCEVPRLDVEPSSMALVPFNHNSSDCDQSPVLDVEPLSIVVPLDQFNANETEQKQHVGFRSPLAKKLENVIKCILRAIGQDQLQVPVIVDSTPELAIPCRDSSRSLENKIESVISDMGRDQMIAILSEEGCSQFSLLERISGWSVSQAPRTNGTVHDSFFIHNLLRRKLRSVKEVIRFILYEVYPGKKQKERQIDDAPSTSEKRLCIAPPLNLHENFQGSKLYDLADESHELADSSILIQHTSKELLRLDPPDSLQEIVEGGKKIYKENL